MAITYHTNYSLDPANLTFGGEWEYLLKVAENEALWLYSLGTGSDLSGLLPHLDRTGNSIAIGYGYDLLQNRQIAFDQLTAAGAQIYDRALFEAQLASLVGKQVTNEDAAQLQLLVQLPDEAAATSLLDIAVATRLVELRDFLGPRGVATGGSRELAVLLSMWYQSPGGKNPDGVPGKNGYFRTATGADTNMTRALITGNAGNDTLDGQAGADTLIGGTGNDTYLLGRGHGAELVQENDATAGNTDIGQFLANIAPDQIWFQQSGSNLIASVIGTPDQFTVQNWYSGSQYRLEQFRTEDGQTLMEAQVQNLVDAMAAFSPPPPGQETLPPEYATQLNPVIAASWQ